MISAQASFGKYLERIDNFTHGVHYAHLLAIAYFKKGGVL